MSAVRYRFGPFTLSPARRSLARDGREVPLIPRYLDLLVLLVERRDVALDRREILDRVWSDVVVSDGALSQAIRTLRRTLEEDEARPFIRTVSRHGYQWVCPVVEERDEDALPARADAVPPAPVEPRVVEHASEAPAPLRVVGSRWASAAAGGAAAGALAGLLGGLGMAALGGSGEPSLLGALVLVAAVVAWAGAAGVGFGLAAAEALDRPGRLVGLVVLGAGGGAAVGLVARLVASSLLQGLFGLGPLEIGGGFEGLALGAAAGLGYGLGTRGPARVSRVVAATALACALAGGLVERAGGRLGASSLDVLVSGFPQTRVRLGLLGRPFGENDLGPRSRTALGAGEGLLFGAGLALGLARRPARR